MVPHLFFHSLVIDPARAFGDAESGAGYLDYMVTQSEFAKVLQQVYDNGYVLVSPHQLATVESDGRVTPKELKLPVGKKPLVISIDDVSYYEYMDGDGFATNLFVAPDGRVLNNYTDAQGVTHQGSYDVMPMVDDFVREHPGLLPRRSARRDRPDRLQRGARLPLVAQRIRRQESRTSIRTSRPPPESRKP